MIGLLLLVGVVSLFFSYFLFFSSRVLFLFLVSRFSFFVFCSELSCGRGGMLSSSCRGAFAGQNGVN